jgi:hypothetical protein
LSGKRINGFGPDAYYDLLDYIKGQYPGTRVVLWSGGVCGDERREGTAHQYDAVVLRTDFDGIRDAVTRFSE